MPEKIVHLFAESDDERASVKKSRRKKPQDIYERLLQPERFESWWTMYRRACHVLECNAGGKREAALQWHRLEQKGIDLEQIFNATDWDVSTRIDLKKQGKFARWLPYGLRYLAAGYWETAIEEMADATDFGEDF